MLRAVLSWEDCNRVVNYGSAIHLGDEFPSGPLKGSWRSTVAILYVGPEEASEEWGAGFYRIDLDVTEIAEGHEIPYLPEALEREQKGPRVDPIWNCSMPGVPRITYMPFPVQILQRPGYVVFMYEYLHDFRIIQTTPREHLEGLEFWLGDSVAKWEDDSLVVDVANQRVETWLDSARHTHSEALHVLERYTRTAPDAILYEATIEDPKTYSRPWKIAMPLHRITEPGFEIREQECVEGDSGRAIHPMYRPAPKQ